MSTVLHPIVGGGIKLLVGQKGAPNLLTPQDHPRLSRVTFRYFCADRNLLKPLITEMRDSVTHSFRRRLWSAGSHQT